MEGGTLNRKSFHFSPSPGWVHPAPGSHGPRNSALRAGLGGRGPATAPLASLGTRREGQPLSPCSAAAARSPRLGPGRSWAGEELPRNSERAPRPQPASAHPPVSAPESTHSSSSPAPSLRSMARSLPRPARGRRRDLGHAPSGPPSTVQPELAGLAAGVSTPWLGPTTPASTAVHRAAPSPGHQGPGTSGCPPRPSLLSGVSVCALG